MPLRTFRRTALVAVAAVLAAAAAVPPIASAMPDREDDELGQVEQAVGPVWRSGGVVTQSGTNCSVLYYSFPEPMIGSFVAYFGDSDAPKVGEVTTARVHVAILGNPCADGVATVGVTLQLPTGVSFAVDVQHPIRCTYHSNAGAGTIDATGTDRCPLGPAQSPEGWSLGHRTLPSGSQFSIDVPLKASRLLRGANQGDRLEALVTPDKAVSPTTAEAERRPARRHGGSRKPVDEPEL